MFVSLLALSMMLVGCGGDGGDSASSSKPEIMLTDKVLLMISHSTKVHMKVLKHMQTKMELNVHTSNLLMQQQMNTTILLIRL